MSAPDADRPRRALERSVTLLIFGLFAAFPLLRAEIALAATAGLVAAKALACRLQLRAAQSLGLVAAISAVLFDLGVGFPPVVFGVASGACLASGQLGWHAPRHPAWLAVGNVKAKTIALAVLTAAVAAAGLVTWYVQAGPDTARIYATFHFRELPAPLLVMSAIAFCATNAAAEEFIYRGFVMQSLRDVAGYVPAVLLQALAFGVLHIDGFPSGGTGMVLAAGYGAMMAVVRTSAMGMLVPWLSHMATDLTIVGILLLAMPP